MTDQTALQRLDDAIHDFAAATGQDGTVGSWVMAYETSRLQTDDPDALPLVHSTNYSIGPATSPATASGLGRYIASVAEDALVNTSHTDEDDE